MTMDLVQHAVVTLVALGAAALVARRVFGAARPEPGAPPACANCPSSGQSCHPATSAPVGALSGVDRHARATAAVATRPLVFVRPGQRQ